MKKFLLAMALLLFAGRAYAQPRFGQLQGYATTAQGGLGMNAGSSSGIPHFSLGVVTFKTIPTCADTGGNHLNWTGSAFACGTSTGTITSLPSLTTFETGALFDDNAYIDFTASAAPPSSPGPGVLRMFGGTTYPRISFKTIDGYVGTLTFDALSASRTWDFPNVSGKFITDGNVADIGMPTCADSGGQHLNWTGSAWACGTSGDGSGHVIYDETTPLTQRANLRFEGAPIHCADSGGETVCIVNEGVSGGSAGYVGGGYILPDRNLASDSNYFITSNSFLTLAQSGTYTKTIANCLTSPPPGWSWGSPEIGTSTAGMAACDTNTTTANALYLKHDNSQTDEFLGTAGSAPTLYSYYGAYGEPWFGWTARISTTTMGTLNPSGTGCRFGIYTFDYSKGNGQKHGFYTRGDGSNNTAFGDIYSSTNAYFLHPTQSQLATGLWLRATTQWNSNATYLYALTNTNDPTAVTWTYQLNQSFAQPGANPALGGVSRVLGISLARQSGGNNCDMKVLYLEMLSITQQMMALGGGNDVPMHSTEVNLWNTVWSGGTQGFSSANPTYTIVASFDLGSSGATISNTALQQALTYATNRRIIDKVVASTAAPTFSANRGSSPSPACAQTYAVAGSATVGGTGRYFSLCVAINSSGTTNGSVSLRDLAIPFAP